MIGAIVSNAFQCLSVSISRADRLSSRRHILRQKQNSILQIFIFEKVGTQNGEMGDSETRDVLTRSAVLSSILDRWVAWCLDDDDVEQHRSRFAD